MMTERNPWWNTFTRAWWRIGMHAHTDLRAAETVECQTCGQEYDAYGGGPMQGHDICAWIKREGPRWVIHCGYGSDFDLSEFWFLKDFPTAEIDGVCDWCIRRMLRAGVIMDSGKVMAIAG